MNKRPESVLVVVHVAGRRFLMLNRAGASGFWQSVTGSLEAGETPVETAIREVREETALEVSASRLRDHRLCNRFEIPPRWRERYPPGTTHNIEHVFSLALVESAPVRWRPGPPSCCWTNRLPVSTRSLLAIFRISCAI